MLTVPYTSPVVSKARVPAKRKPEMKPDWRRDWSGSGGDGICAIEADDDSDPPTSPLYSRVFFYAPEI